MVALTKTKLSDKSQNSSWYKNNPNPVWNKHTTNIYLTFFSMLKDLHCLHGLQPGLPQIKKKKLSL